MTLPAARTRDEAHLYMDLHPCAECGDADVPWENAILDDAGTPVRRYTGTCPGCGAVREFVFALPERPAVLPDHEVLSFGGPERSELLDAGEWLWVSDLAAQSATGVALDPEGVRVADAEAREALAVAVAALNEILKFVPDGADAVPDSAFWSDRGRELRHAAPGRFERRRLQAVRDTYRDRLDGAPLL